MEQCIIILNQYYQFNGNKKYILYSNLIFYIGQINIHVMMLIPIVHFYFNIHVVIHFEMDKQQRMNVI